MENQIDANEAERIVEQAKQQRLSDCQQEIKIILAKYRAALVAVARITPDGRIVAVVQIMPRGIEGGTIGEE